MEMQSLFENRSNAPLAHRMRPNSLAEFAGQNHLLGERKPLELILHSPHPPSLLLWGPPGTGKTTLARLFAKYFDARFVPFSAVTGGLPELREIVKEAQNQRRLGKRTILFVDEIHRFHKGQQDAFLPHVEDGTLTLVGATTENPSFEVNSALLSRTRVFVLQALSNEDIRNIVLKALLDKERGLGLTREDLPPESMELLVELAGGDARKALNALEAASTRRPISADAIHDAFQVSTPYDKDGESHHDTISAYIKSVRGSDPDAAIYWLARMIAGGEDPLFIARRLVILASEDIGNADPHGLMLATSALEAVRLVGMPEGRIPLAQATVYLACAPKSNASYQAINAALSFVNQRVQPPVPLHLRNAPTKLLKELGYGREYLYPHDFGGHVEQGYWPDSFEPRRFFLPTGNGYEAQIRKRLSGLRGERSE